MKLQPPEVLPAPATCLPQLLAKLAQSWMGGWDVDPLFGASSAVQSPSPLPETQTPGRGGRQMLRVRGSASAKTIRTHIPEHGVTLALQGSAQRCSNTAAVLGCQRHAWAHAASQQHPAGQRQVSWLPAQCSSQSLALTCFVPKSTAICIQWNKLHYTCLFLKRTSELLFITIWLPFYSSVCFSFSLSLSLTLWNEWQDPISLRR